MYRYHFLPGTNSSLLGRIGGVSDSGLSIGIPRVSLIEWLKCDREGSDSQYHNRFTSKDGSLFIDMNETWLPSIYMKEMTLLARKTGAFTFFLLSVSYCPHTQIQKNLKLIFKKIRESTLWRTEELQTYSKNRSKCILLLWIWPLTLEYSILFFFFILSSHSTNCNKDVWTKHQQGNVRIHILSLHISQNHDTDKPTVCAAARCATCSRGSKWKTVR